MYFGRQVSLSFSKFLPSFFLTLYHVPHRRQKQLSLKCKILVSCRIVANGSRLLGCDTAVIGSTVTGVSKDHSAFFNKVRQSMNLKA
jgi:hypothetical protein